MLSGITGKVDIRGEGETPPDFCFKELSLENIQLEVTDHTKKIEKSGPFTFPPVALYRNISLLFFLLLQPSFFFPSLCFVYFFILIKIPSVWTRFAHQKFSKRPDIEILVLGFSGDWCGWT